MADPYFYYVAAQFRATKATKLDLNSAESYGWYARPTVSDSGITAPTISDEQVFDNPFSFKFNKGNGIIFEKYIAPPGTLPMDPGRFASADFVIEGKFRAPSLTGGFVLIECWNSTNGWYVGVNANGTIYLKEKALTVTLTSTTGVALFTIDTNHHIVVNRTGSVLRIFLDGVQVATKTLLTAHTWTPVAPNYLCVGGLFNNRNAALDFEGFADDIRITKGFSRWESAFTPPGPSDYSDNTVVAGNSFEYSYNDSIANAFQLEKTYIESIDSNPNFSINNYFNYLDNSGSGDIVDYLTIDGIPAIRKVTLLERDSKRIVRTAYSESSGLFKIPSIDTNISYMLIGEDNVGELSRKNATVRDFVKCIPKLLVTSIPSNNFVGVPTKLFEITATNFDTIVEITPIADSGVTVTPSVITLSPQNKTAYFNVISTGSGNKSINFINDSLVDGPNSISFNVGFSDGLNIQAPNEPIVNGVVSEQFTVVLVNYDGPDIEVTLISDDAVTISANKVTVGTLSPEATFTITPTAVGIINLGFTNNQGLANPYPLTINAFTVPSLIFGSTAKIRPIVGINSPPGIISILNPVGEVTVSLVASIPGIEIIPNTVVLSKATTSAPFRINASVDTTFTVTASTTNYIEDSISDLIESTINATDSILIDSPESLNFIVESNTLDFDILLDNAYRDVIVTISSTDPLFEINPSNQFTLTDVDEFKSFNILPTVPGNYILSFENNSGLPNPLDINYTVLVPKVKLIKIPEVAYINEIKDVFEVQLDNYNTDTTITISASASCNIVILNSRQTVPNGFNLTNITDKVSFTIEPLVYGPLTITLTNNKSIANPAATDFIVIDMPPTELIVIHPEYDTLYAGIRSNDYIVKLVNPREDVNISRDSNMDFLWTGNAPYANPIILSRSKSEAAFSVKAVSAWEFNHVEITNNGGFDTIMLNIESLANSGFLVVFSAPTNLVPFILNEASPLLEINAENILTPYSCRLNDSEYTKYGEYNPNPVILDPINTTASFTYTPNEVAFIRHRITATPVHYPHEDNVRAFYHHRDPDNTGDLLLNYAHVRTNLEHGIIRREITGTLRVLPFAYMTYPIFYLEDSSKTVELSIAYTKGDGSPNYNIEQTLNYAELVLQNQASPEMTEGTYVNTVTYIEDGITKSYVTTVEVAYAENICISGSYRRDGLVSGYYLYPWSIALMRNVTSMYTVHDFFKFKNRIASITPLDYPVDVTFTLSPGVELITHVGVVIESNTITLTSSAQQTQFAFRFLTTGTKTVSIFNNKNIAMVHELPNSGLPPGLLDEPLVLTYDVLE